MLSVPLDWVLHIMAVVQLRNATEGRAYYDRKVATGKTPNEAVRSLKRRRLVACIRYGALSVDAHRRLGDRVRARLGRMTMAGVVLAAAIGVSAATPGHITAASATTLSQMGCFPEAGTVEADGTFNHVVFNDQNVIGPVYRDYISTLGPVTALGSTTLEYVGANTFRTFAVHAGYLRLDTTRYSNSNPAARTFTSRAVGTRWGNVTKIVDASDRQSAYTKNGYLYGLSPQYGILGRYKVTEPTFGAPSVANAGYRTGYGAFRTLALAYKYREGTSSAADVLIGTTATGQLDLITVPITGTFSPRVTVLRSSTWTFDDLFVNGCNTNGQFSLVAVRHSTQRAYLYKITSISSSSVAMSAYGAISGAWPSVHSSAFWYSGAYPVRW